jgi:glycosyltransferase involved in cell wall biosynthesis
MYQRNSAPFFSAPFLVFAGVPILHAILATGAFSIAVSTLPTLTLVIPCYNPRAGWHLHLAKQLSAMRAALAQEVAVVGVVIVNDGSHTALGADLLTPISDTGVPAQMLTYSPNRGKGYALRTGVAATRSELVVYTDIDFPYTQASMLAICRALLAGADVAAGVRPATYFAQVPWFRKRLSLSFRWLLKRSLRLAISDTQAGIKGFNAKGKTQFLRTTIDRFLFDLEFIYNSSQQKDLVVRAVEVDLRPGITFSRMSTKVLATEFLNFLKLLLRR